MKEEDKVISTLAKLNWELSDKLNRIRNCNDVIYQFSKRVEDFPDSVRSAIIDIEIILDTNIVWEDDYEHN